VLCIYICRCIISIFLTLSNKTIVRFRMIIFLIFYITNTSDETYFEIAFYIEKKTENQNRSFTKVLNKLLTKQKQNIYDINIQCNSNSTKYRTLYLFINRCWNETCSSFELHDVFSSHIYQRNNLRRKRITNSSILLFLLNVK
jgi:hypothetical protein